MFLHNSKSYNSWKKWTLHRVATIVLNTSEDKCTVQSEPKCFFSLIDKSSTVACHIALGVFSSSKQGCKKSIGLPSLNSKFALCAKLRRTLCGPMCKMKARFVGLDFGTTVFAIRKHTPGRRTHNLLSQMFTPP